MIDPFAKFETIVPRYKKDQYAPARIVFIPIADKYYADAIRHPMMFCGSKAILGSPQLLYPHQIDFDQLTGLADRKSLDDLALE